MTTLVTCSTQGLGLALADYFHAPQFGTRSANIYGDNFVETLGKSISFSGVTRLILNHPTPTYGYHNELATMDWDREFRMMRNLIHLTTVVTQTMMDNQYGRILYLSSHSVACPMPSRIVSNTVRAGLENHVRTIGMDQAQNGILANSLRIGRIADTPSLNLAIANRADRQGISYERAEDYYASEMPTKKLSTKEEFVSLVDLLTRANNKSINAQNITMDAGLNLQT